MNDKEKELYKKHLVALLYVFKDKPNILANYILDHESLKKRFVDKIKESDKLARISESLDNNEYVKPFFINLEEMQKYFNSLFGADEKENTKKQVNPILGASSTKEALFNQLKNAIDEEDYEKASKLRDYMSSVGFNLDDFLN